MLPHPNQIFGPLLALVPSIRKTHLQQCNFDIVNVSCYTAHLYRAVAAHDRKQSVLTPCGRIWNLYRAPVGTEVITWRARQRDLVGCRSYQRRRLGGSDEPQTVPKRKITNAVDRAA